MKTARTVWGGGKVRDNFKDLPIVKSAYSERLTPLRGGTHKIGTPESFIVKGQYSCTSDSRRYSKPFIPIVTEYMVIFHKDNPLIIPFSWTRTGECDITKRDCQTLTWYHLIRSVMEQLGGTAELSQLYQMLENHPKARANAHYKERIRATLYEHKDTYIQTGNGQYRLNYTVA